MSAATVVAPAHENAETMSTRWPAHVKRTAVTAEEPSPTRGRQDWAMLVRLVVLAVLVWLSVCAVLFVWPRDDSPRRADAVVVLAGGRKLRLEKGLELMRRDLAHTLVISDGEARGWLEANRLCKGAATGFRVVCFTPDPYSTQGEAQGVARLARERG